jgi:hypothetical protein
MKKRTIHLLQNRTFLFVARLLEKLPVVSIHISRLFCPLLY